VSAVVVVVAEVVDRHVDEKGNDDEEKDDKSDERPSSSMASLLGGGGFNVAETGDGRGLDRPTMSNKEDAVDLSLLYRTDPGYGLHRGVYTYADTRNVYIMCTVCDIQFCGSDF